MRRLVIATNNNSIVRADDLEERRFVEFDACVEVVELVSRPDLLQTGSESFIWGS